MFSIPNILPRRAQPPFAQTNRRFVKGIPPGISDELARDIGMTAQDIARHRFQWPSDSKDRPLL